MSVLDRSSQLRQDRQHERRRLAGARLRDADDIVSGENVRDGCDLDRSRLGVTRVVHGLQEPGAKDGVRERAWWPGLSSVALIPHLFFRQGARRILQETSEGPVQTCIALRSSA